MTVRPDAVKAKKRLKKLDIQVRRMPGNRMWNEAPLKWTAQILEEP